MLRAEALGFRAYGSLGLVGNGLQGREHRLEWDHITVRSIAHSKNNLGMNPNPYSAFSRVLGLGLRAWGFGFRVFFIP